MTSTFEIIRPANTVAYASGDVINNDAVTTMLETSHLLGLTTVLSASIVSSNPAGTPDFSLFCYSNNFAIALDNAAFDPSDADARGGRLGRIKFAASDWAAFPSNKCCDGKPLAPFNFKQGQLEIYCVLVADSAYTPISGEVITISISDTL